MGKAMGAGAWKKNKTTVKEQEEYKKKAPGAHSLAIVNHKTAGKTWILELEPHTMDKVAGAYCMCTENTFNAQQRSMQPRCLADSHWEQSLPLR